MAKTGSVQKPALNAAQKGDVKRANFVRVVTPRITKAIKAIGVIANCAGSNYVYSDIQIAQILSALDGAVKQVESAFAKKAVTQTGFSFKG
jgi:L-asparaginase II